MVTLYLSEKEALLILKSLEYVLFYANIFWDDEIIIVSLKDELKVKLHSSGIG